ncbi:pentapeptide repeat-containing protein [Nonomuraea sp. NPDC048916]|uniref:pentapeptide repeat-containing protein n=1 Tax=Nonomuraea sp. NPDC048916 TaxID=3154232 RepID=UPI003407A37E
MFAPEERVGSWASSPGTTATAPTSFVRLSGPELAERVAGGPLEQVFGPLIGEPAAAGLGTQVARRGRTAGAGFAIGQEQGAPAAARDDTGEEFGGAGPPVDPAGPGRRLPAPGGQVEVLDVEGEHRADRRRALVQHQPQRALAPAQAGQLPQRVEVCRVDGAGAASGFGPAGEPGGRLAGQEPVGGGPGGEGADRAPVPVPRGGGGVSPRGGEDPGDLRRAHAAQRSVVAELAAQPAEGLPVGADGRGVQLVTAEEGARGLGQSAARLRHARLRHARLRHARLRDARLRDARLRGGRVGAGRGAFEQDRTFGHVEGESRCAFELPPGLVGPAELGQQVAAHAGQAVVALESRFGDQRVGQLQARFGAVGHGHRDRAVELHHRRGQHPGEHRVEGGDLRPVGLLGTAGPRVAGGDGGLQHVRAKGAAGPPGAQQGGEAAADEELVPAAAVLLVQHDGLARRSRPGG